MSQVMGDDLVEDCRTFINRYCDARDGSQSELSRLLEQYPNEKRALEIDYTDIQRFDQALADDLLKKPDRILDHFEEALATYDVPVDIDLSNATVRVSNLPEWAERQIGKFSTDDVNSLVGVRGQVTKKSKQRPIVEEAAFECQVCGTLNYIPQAGEKLQSPGECEGCERTGPYDLSVEQSDVRNHQLVRVQVPPERAEGGSGEHLDVNLYEGLVDEAQVGDRVTVGAKLQADPEDEDGSRVLEWSAEGQSIQKEQTDYEDIEVAPHVDRIQEIAAENPFESIVNSIKPSHKGDDAIKQAIALQMFGGVRKELPDGSVKRGDSHILLVGDPGCDKSGLIKYAKKLSPRSIYTSGKSSTGAGLTAAAVKSDFGDGGWTIEGGAMVRANKGLAAIDELDKMSDDDRGSIFEALAEQSISVSKAGINATLPARTKLLAAANPVHGRFDQHQAIGEQIQLDPALISRFDLIFTMTDTPDEEEDRAIAKHINKGARVAMGDESAGEGVVPEIEPDVMRAYIAYARQNYRPRITEEADERIADWYASIRTANLDGDGDTPIPTTPRKVEAAHRLAEASARIRLSDTVEVEDVERILSIVERCLRDVGIDPETGEFDVDMVETGQSTSQRNRRERLLDIIDELVAELDKRGAPRSAIIEQAAEEGYDKDKIDHDIDHLSEKGEIYQPGRNKYRTS